MWGNGRLPSAFHHGVRVGTRGLMEESKKRVRLLLVDDEQEATQILAKRLTRRGYECRLACNGRDAIDKMGVLESQIVVMDVKMPVMDGIEALSMIVAKWPWVKVILLSGHADMQLAVEAMNMGAFGYLMKPTDMDELLFKIEDAVHQQELEIAMKEV